MAEQDGTHDLPRVEPDPAEPARRSIYSLFEAGVIDEDHATAALLAIDLGCRRAQQYTSRAASRCVV